MTLLLAFGVLIVLLLLGTAAGRAMGTTRWGVPEALLAGALGLLIAPEGPLPLLPEGVIQVWSELPLVLLTLVFGALLLAKPLPRIGALWRPVASQLLLALTLAFGQFLVGGLAVLLVLQPLVGAPPVMAALIEVAYEGGHGSAAAMGPSYARLGLESGESLGLAMATVGLLTATVVGGLVVVLGRSRRWLLATQLPIIAAADCSGRPDRREDHETPWSRILQGLQTWPPNLALTGTAVLLGVLMLNGLQLLAARTGGGFALVIEGLPAFPLALLGSLLVRFTLERSGMARWVSQAVQVRIGTLAADLLITAATACLDLRLLADQWLPLVVLALAGLAWNVCVVLLLAPRILPSNWFERGLVEFGQATGVAASGLLLLAMVDPQDQGDALTPFSIKQLLLQPLIAGGIITVMAPLAIDGWGLRTWTGFCFGLVVLWVVLGLWLGRSHPAPTPSSQWP
ncbi:MAG: sodium/glutamate symporter [Cyanobacteriota bacterium]|nr:sodium/glutamate symporter [Cyanobacteriota bacterium]